MRSPLALAVVLALGAYALHIVACAAGLPSAPWVLPQYHVAARLRSPAQLMLFALLVLLTICAVLGAAARRVHSSSSRSCGVYRIYAVVTPIVYGVVLLSHPRGLIPLFPFPLLEFLGVFLAPVLWPSHRGRLAVCTLIGLSVIGEVGGFELVYVLK